LVWITNPVTIPLFFGFEYWLGTIILGRPFGTIDFTNIGSTGQEMLQTLYVGGLTVSSIAGLLGYFGIQIFWKYQIFKKIKRRKK
jgi:uncharacterized protein (DUF2062 family)